MPLTSGSRVINGRTDRKRRAQAGIILLDVVLTLAIFGLIALLVLPTLPRGTTPSRQGAYAAQIAALMI